MNTKHVPSYVGTIDPNDTELLQDMKDLLKRSGFCLSIRGRGPRKCLLGTKKKYTRRFLQQDCPQSRAESWAIYVRVTPTHDWQNLLYEANQMSYDAQSRGRARWARKIRQELTW